ncbi:MAG: protein translocase SEC61 complex subunit gamma [Methanotrichaceae archaeon]
MAEDKIQQFKDKFALNEIGNREIALPPMNLEDYVRVLKLARKPDYEEFINISQISMAGIGIIGVIGFLLYALLTELPRTLR